MTPIRVLLIDDHPVIHDALRQVIGSQPDMMVCGTGDTAASATQLLHSVAPDLIVLDLILNDAHGLDVTQHLVATHPDVCVLIYSMHDETVYAERALRAGARGYLMKSEPTQCVIEAIRSTHRGEVYLSNRMALRVLSSMAAPHREHAGFSVDTLTDQEMKVLHLLGNGNTLGSIAKKLHLSQKTVETYRRRVRKKLGLQTQNELLHFALQFSQGQVDAEREGRTAPA